jgi:hypothetical protein
MIYIDPILASLARMAKIKSQQLIKRQRQQLRHTHGLIPDYAYPAEAEPGIQHRGAAQITSKQNQV